MFHIGQQVVCIDADWSGKFDMGDCPNRPVKGEVYTIRGFRAPPHPEGVGVFLEEVVNAPFDYGMFGDVREPCFRAARFRPVRKTDISIFHKLLAPTPKVDA
jgi:hypothetical protein